MPAPVRFLIERRRRFSEARARQLSREIVAQLEREGIHRGTSQVKPAGGFFYFEIEPKGSALPLILQSVSRGARFSRLRRFATPTACQVAGPSYGSDQTHSTELR
jgi:hypothetical protein